MRLTGVIGLLTLVAMHAQAQMTTREPTHIIKFKGQANLNQEAGKL